MICTHNGFQGEERTNRVVLLYLAYNVTPHTHTAPLHLQTSAQAIAGVQHLQLPRVRSEEGEGRVQNEQGSHGH